MAFRWHLRKIGALLAFAVILAFFPSGTSLSVSEQEDSVDPPRSVPAEVHGHVHAAPHGVMPRAVTPQEVRLQLEQLLGQHTTLAIRLMRGEINKSPDFVEAATAALGKNTDELAALVAGAYGPEGGAEFKRLWAQHVSSLFKYTKGAADKDTTAQQSAQAELDRYTKDFGTFISTATKGELPAAQVTAGVDSHIDHLIHQIEAYSSGDYATAYRLEREAYAAMFTTGKGLAAATVSSRSGELPAGFDNPPQQLRSALGRLLGEHSELIVDSTRAVLAREGEFEHATAALDGNTRDITQAVTAVFGSGAAGPFADLWGTHVDAVVSFATAVAENDTAGQARARARLDRWSQDFGRFLATGVNNTRAATAFVAAAHHHDQQLMASIEAYAGGDFAKAHQISYEGYQHMFAITESLADAIESGTAKRIPKGGAATGGGGTSGANGR